MNNPDKITFTGVDEKTNIQDLVRLSQKYPVEWGILFSKNNQGRANRYPSFEWIQKFLDEPVTLNLSAHICGQFSHNIMKGDWNPVFEKIIKGYFKRTQININDGETFVKEPFDPNWSKWVYWFQDRIRAEAAIVQCRDDFPKHASVHWLYDKSGGAGISPNSWEAKPDATDAYCGYAGGIGPHNVIETLKQISYTRKIEKPFWIDMEGNVRTNDWFDIDKCESVLKQVYGA